MAIHGFFRENTGNRQDSYVGENAVISCMVFCVLPRSSRGRKCFKSPRRKRLSLYTEGVGLYLEDYDSEIFFDNKESRRKRHQMGRRHVEGLTIKGDHGKSRFGDKE